MGLLVHLLETSKSLAWGSWCARFRAHLSPHFSVKSLVVEWFFHSLRMILPCSCLHGIFEVISGIFGDFKVFYIAYETWALWIKIRYAYQSILEHSEWSPRSPQTPKASQHFKDAIMPREASIPPNKWTIRGKWLGIQANQFLLRANGLQTSRKRVQIWRKPRSKVQSGKYIGHSGDWCLNYKEIFSNVLGTSKLIHSGEWCLTSTLFDSLQVKSKGYL